MPSKQEQKKQQTIYAAERARLLFGSFLQGKANDPETFIAAVTIVLAQYPKDVITTVTHPDGLPSQQTFLPSIHEIRLACEAIEAPRREREARKKRVEKQLAERAEWEATHKRLTKDSPEARALFILHEIADATAFFKKVCIDKDGSVFYPQPMMPQLQALALAGPKDEWPVLTHQQAGAWERLLRDNVTVQVRKHLKAGDRAPWIWPPRVDGTFSTTGPPPALTASTETEDDLADHFQS